MSDQTNPRDAAIEAFLRREAEKNRDASDLAQLQQEETSKWHELLETWSNRTFQTIATGVTAASSDFARRGSPFIVRHPGQDRVGIANFEVHRSESLIREATLTFALGQDGL